MEINENLKITFGIIVLNGEPFTRYCLRSIYPFAHEIIVVEGGHEDTKSVCTPDGHSIDGTLDVLYKFKKEEDDENKLTIITREGFWPKKDELGHDRTPQSRAYAEIATGDYLWQIDIDEFYLESDMKKIIKMLKEDSSINAVSFKQKSFWGNINYISDGCYLRRNEGGWHRIFKWAKNYKYLTHEPPTIIDENGIDLRSQGWITGEMMSKHNIYMYHYCLLFPSQVEQKSRLYREEKPEYYAQMLDWATNHYYSISNPYRVHNVYTYPSWLIRYNGQHPHEIINMMEDINKGKIDVPLRQTKDIEAILSKWWYSLGIAGYKVQDFFVWNFIRFKHRFVWIKKILNPDLYKNEVSK